MLGKRLSDLRKKHKITQVDISKKLGVNRSTYANYETGLREPDNETLQRLADYFEVSIDYLLGRTDDPTPSRKTLNEEFIPYNINYDTGTYKIGGKEVSLTLEEVVMLEELKRYPIMFHDLMKDPEKISKTIARMYEVIKTTLEEDDDRDDIFKD